MMGGWIKLEKDLLTDPRLVSAAMELEARFQLMETTGEIAGSSGQPIAEFSNASPLPGVTLLLGALARLWILADTHIGENDVLALNVNQIDKLVGIDGFCNILPRNWLEILDGERVKLPRYHEHNGTVAKERALNQKRVTKSRDKKKFKTVTHGNARTLPDLDQDLYLDQHQDLERERAARAPTAQRLPDDFELTEERKATARAEAVNPEREFARFCDHWRASAGPNARKRDWDAAWRNWCRKAAEFKPQVSGSEDTGWRPTQ